MFSVNQSFFFEEYSLVLLNAYVLIIVDNHVSLLSFQVFTFGFTSQFCGGKKNRKRLKRWKPSERGRDSWRLDLSEIRQSHWFSNKVRPTVGKKPHARVQWKAPRGDTCLAAEDPWMPREGTNEDPQIVIQQKRILDGVERRRKPLEIKDSRWPAGGAERSRRPIEFFLGFFSAPFGIYINFCSRTEMT